MNQTSSEAEWKKKLSPEAYRVLRQGGTEPAFSGELLYNAKTGQYTCGACGMPLFDSKAKFDSGSGWPSFWDSIDPSKVELLDDASHGMRRVEVRCANCHSHLGHVFDDAPQTPTGKRYCINSAALRFKEKTP